MRKAIFAASLSIAQLYSAYPAMAGLKADLASCASGKSTASAQACTRVLNSGRLKRSHRYIAYYNRAWAHRNSGALDEALRDFNRSLKYNSKFADTYYSRAVVHYEQADEDSARKDLETYVKLGGGNWKAYYKRALMLRRLGDVELALADVEKAEQRKDAKAVRLLRALLLSDRNEHDKALQVIGGDVAADCGSARACYARAVVLMRKNLFEKSLADLDRAIEKRKVYAAAYTMKGRVLEQLGRGTEAADAYEESVSLNVGSVEELLAQKDARALLAAARLKDNLPVAKREVTRETVFACRRFVPMSNSTISVPCS